MVADDPVTVDLLDQALQRAVGSNQHTEPVDNVHTQERPSGNEASRALRRLRKDRPDLHARVLAGELSPHAAMREAGRGACSRGRFVRGFPSRCVTHNRSASGCGAAGGLTVSWLLTNMTNRSNGSLWEGSTIMARQAQGTRQRPRTARKMPPAESRTLQNWLSTRVEQGGVAGHLVVAPDCHAHERALVASRLARARELGLVVVPGAYIERPKRSGREQEEQPERAPHLVHCGSCDLSYRATHLHCCLCGQVFKSASAYERHAAGTGAGRCATPEQLRRRHLHLGVDGVWRREAPHTLAG